MLHRKGFEIKLSEMLFRVSLRPEESLPGSPKVYLEEGQKTKPIPFGIKGIRHVKVYSWV